MRLRPWSLEWRLGIPLLAAVLLGSAVPASVTYVLLSEHLTHASAGAALLRTCAVQATLLLLLGVAGMAAVMRLVVKPLSSSFDHMAGELIRQKVWLDSVLESVPDPLVVLDGERSIRKVNRAFEASTGKPAAELLGSTLAGVVEGHGPGVLEEALVKTPEGACFVDASCVLHGKDGRGIPVFLSAAMMPGGAAVLVLKDLTELRGVQEDLMRATRLAAVGEVAGYAAHEVLNPVTSLLGRLHRMERNGTELRAEHLEVGRAIVGAWGDALEDGGPPGLLRTLIEPAGDGARPMVEEDLGNLSTILDHYEGEGLKLKDDLEFMKRELQRVGSIVDGMRTLSRKNQSVEALDLRRVAGEAVETQTDAMHKRGIRLAWDLASHPIPVRADRNEVVQALTNLLRNAVQAIDARGGPGNIRVSVRADGGQASVLIADDGCGMAPDVVPYVFEAGFTTKTAEDGTGLGLGLSRRFIRSFGGDVTVARTGPGEGTEMRVTLPVVREEEGAPARRESPLSEAA